MKELIKKIKSSIQLSLEAEEYLLSISKKKTFSKGEILIQQGQNVNKIYFVTDGCLRSYCIDKSGKEHTLQFAIKNWWIGDYITLYTEEKSILSIEAITKSKILLIDKVAIEKLYLEYPEFETFQRKNLERRLATLQKRILNLLALTAVEKYDKFISEYAEFAQIIPNYQIASYLGITPESLSRVRKRKIHKS